MMARRKTERLWSGLSSSHTLSYDNWCEGGKLLSHLTGEGWEEGMAGLRQAVVCADASFHLASLRRKGRSHDPARAMLCGFFFQGRGCFSVTAESTGQEVSVFQDATYKSLLGTTETRQLRLQLETNNLLFISQDFFSTWSCPRVVFPSVYFICSATETHESFSMIFLTFNIMTDTYFSTHFSMVSHTYCELCLGCIAVTCACSLSDWAEDVDECALTSPDTNNVDKNNLRDTYSNTNFSMY